MINELAKKYLGNDVQYLEEYGIPQLQIDKILEATEYDLLIIGTKGRSALSNMLFGSTTEHLLHTATKPVLVVPQ